MEHPPSPLPITPRTFTLSHISSPFFPIFILRQGLSYLRAWTWDIPASFSQKDRTTGMHHANGTVLKIVLKAQILKNSSEAC